MTPLGRLLRDVGAGEVAWAEALPRLVDWNYEPTSRSRLAPAVTAVEVYDRAEDETYLTAGSWDEVRRARDRGLLTAEQYREVVEGRAAD